MTQERPKGRQRGAGASPALARADEVGADKPTEAAGAAIEAADAGIEAGEAPGAAIEAADAGGEAEDADSRAALRQQAVSAVGHVLRPRSYAGLARELALGAFHASTYPLGLLPGLRPTSAPTRADADAVGAEEPADEASAQRPVILVHGYVHNRSAFLVMSRALRRAGFRHVRGINYNPLAQDMATIAVRLAEEVEDALASTGAERCAIVGHSMGGIVARHYVQLLGGEDHVDTVITLGSPHRGSYTSYVGLGEAAAQLRPGSQYLRHLEETARPSAVRWIAYYSDLDMMVVPAVHAKLVHPALSAENIRIRDTGHLSLLLSREVLRGVAAHLSGPRADESESPADAGRVTDLPPAARRRAGG